MIVAKNLTKLYSPGKDEVLALDSLNFTLPDKGLVFIVGKSGSGKSTLINMIGGLDDITSGEVIVDGMNIKGLDQRSLDEYHNNYLGIIYQNYNLFEEETVLNNIQISNIIAQNKKSVEEIEELLSKLELNGRSDSLVMNLSGGQKQRVAIARALVKDPKLILADEPTGNLDSKTTKSIFNLLKKISKDRLVIVITHDMKSALNYADRILSLTDGRIEKDLTKNVQGSSSVTYVELDDTQEIDEAKINELNETIKKTKFHLIRKGHHFIPTENLENPENTQEFSRKKTKLTLKKSLSTGLKASKRNIFSLLSTSLISTFIIGLLSISESFINFRAASAISDLTDRYELNNIIIRKTFSKTHNIMKTEKDHMVEINDVDEQRFDDLHVEGRRFPLYNVNLLYSSALGTWPDASLYQGGVKYENFYPANGYGVIQCDQEYLTKVFKREPEVIAGAIDENTIGGNIIISDFTADSIIFYNPGYESDDDNEPYKKLLGKKISDRFRPVAIIKSDYKEKYGDFVEIAQRMARELQKANELRKQFLQDDLFVSFVNDCEAYLNFGYTFDPNFHDNYITFSSQSYMTNTTYVYDDYPYEADLPFECTNIAYKKEIKDYEALMNINTYNLFFNTQFTDIEDPNFQEHTITFYNYSYDDVLRESVKHTITLKIVGLAKANTNNHFFTSLKTSQELRTWHLFQFGWAYDDPADCYKIYTGLLPYYFYNSVNCFKAVYNTIDAITVFSQVFSALLYILLGVLAIVIILHNVRIIRKEQYRLGVYKSLGYSNLYLTIVILLTNLIMMVAIFAISSAFSYGASLLANYCLQYGFFKYSSNRVYFLITLLIFEFKFVAIFNAITLGLMLVSSFVPLLIIRRIKPSKIIRNAE